jgi:transporter family protein
LIIAYFALAVRIILLGFERIFLKLMGTDETKDESLQITAVFFAFGTLGLLPFALLNLEFSFYLFFPVISSIFYSFAFWMYTSSLQKGEISLVTPLYNFNLVFLLIFSTIFLDESLTFFKIFGVFLIFFGLSYLQKGSSILESIKNVFNDNAAQLMIGASLLIAIGRIIDGFIVGDQFEPVVYAFYIYLFITIVLLILLYLTGKDVKEPLGVFQENRKLSIIAGFTNAGTYLSLLIAFTVIDVSIAEPIGTLNVFVAMFLAQIIFKEEIKQRIIAASLIILGSLLLILSKA